MGVAERWLRSRFGPEVCDHHTFVVCSDGDLEEGISHEAASLAGHLGLGRLVYVYDDNHISIDGPTELALSDDSGARFEAYGWHVERLGEAANDVGGLEAGLRRAMAVEDRPSLLILRSHIGWPSPTFTDTATAHGSPLGEEEVRRTKEILGLPPDETFWVPDDVLALYRGCIPRGQAARREWEARQDLGDGERAAYHACLAGGGLPGWEAALPVYEAGTEVATRVASGQCLDAVVDVVPGLLAGGADLTGNTGTRIDGAERQSAASPGGRQVYFGVREHGMGGVMNGMALHGGVLPVGGTFFNFSDYMRGAVRLAAIGEAHVVYSWTHDSVGLGEDGPTHQPVEQLAAMRAMPGLRVIRPADANETAQAWAVAVNRKGPTALVLARQKVPVLEGTSRAGQVARGAYVLVDSEVPPDVVLIGTGSEVSLCLDAARLLEAENAQVRVVSMPSWELFAEQDETYRTAVLPGDVPRLAVEAAASFGWERYADASVSIDRFGASAPGAVALENLGYTPADVAARGRALLRARSGS
jgi:transketolase